MPEAPKLHLLDSREGLPPRDAARLAGTFPYRPTLFLGLGGTGTQAVEKVKRLFLDYVAPHAQAGVMATVPAIPKLYCFRGFDTNAGERPAELTPGREWFHIGVSNLSQFYKGMGAGDFFRDWLVQGYPAGSIMAGCSGYRGLGRLALADNINTVAHEIDKARGEIMEAAAGLAAVMTVPVVHLFCSLSGGTGSGMLLDVCFLLREIFPDVRLVGHIAVLDGLPQMADAARRKVSINTFCGLSELNAFMTGHADTVPAGMIQYPLDVRGEVREPLDECYLISSNRSDDTLNLPTHAHVTSFLARMAFMMSAYSFRPDNEQASPDYEGVMVDSTDRLVETHGGARTCYLAPGFVQIHFPVNQVAELLILNAARQYLRYQAGGTAQLDNDEEARQFFLQNDLKYTALRQQLNPSDEVVASRYDEAIRSLFENRYANREEILAYAHKVPGGRYAEFKGRLAPNVDKLFQEIWPKIQKAASEYFEKDGYLAAGAADFASDLRQLLLKEVEKLASDAAVQVDSEYDDLTREWKQIESIVDDVLVKNGQLDAMLDHFHAHNAQSALITFLNQADQVILDKARNELTAALLNRLTSELSGLVQGIEQFQQNATQAITLVRAQEVALSTALHTQTEAADSSPEHIRSANAMSEEWRNTYIGRKGITGRVVLGWLRDNGWSAIELLNLRPAPGETAGKALGDSVTDLIGPFFESIRHWSPTEVLDNTEKICSQSPVDVIGKVYFSLLQPQLQINGMKNRLGVPVDEVIFAGGLDATLLQRLQQSDKFAGVAFNAADNQETTRINFASATLPIALAGCDLATGKLEKAYRQWLKEIEAMRGPDQEFNRRLYHCFPNSHHWPLCTQFSQGASQGHEVFARALAISEMIPPSDSDHARMFAIAKNPKEQGYAIFQFSNSSFWLWPFFIPNDPSCVIQGKPVKLGSNVKDACEFVSKSQDVQSRVRKWVDWFEEHWSELFTGPQVDGLREKAIQAFYERKGKSGDPEWDALWDEIAEVVQKWPIG